LLSNSIDITLYSSR